MVGGSEYNPPQIILPTPFTFGSTMVNTYSTVIGYYYGPQFGDHYVHYIRTITADAFGTLTTPAGTYSNVLRIKTYETSNDSFIYGNGNFSAYGGTSYDTSLSYMWVQNYYNNFLMQINMNSTGTAAISASYLKLFTDTIPDLVSIFPNPCKGNFTIKPEGLLKTFHCMIYDINGRALLDETINGKTDIGVYNLNEGIYNVNINGIINKKLVIMR